MDYNLITILGPTASGKTTLAAHVAYELGTEIISADSRQVYRGMDIGTGKDIADYTVNGKNIPFHLIDICEAGQKFNVYEYQQEFSKVFYNLTEKAIIPILCGGSGLYIEAVLKSYKMASVPINEALRKQLETKSDQELVQLLSSYKKLHNTSDTDTRKRLVRAIEIEVYQNEHEISVQFPEIKSLLVGIHFERDEQRKRITQRLKERLANGLIDEVKTLLNKGISEENLLYYGLEYKYITQYITGKLGYDEMFNLLNIAIHQFSKRQMTWFRKMERSGSAIHWIDGKLPLNEKAKEVFSLID